MKGRARRDRREKGDEDCAWVAMAHAGDVEEDATGVEDVGRTAGALLDGELVEGDGVGVDEGGDGLDGLR